MPVTAPPIAGPVTPPKRNPAWNAPEARPRCAGPAVRSSRAIAETVNIADPMPPTPRSTSSCPKLWARAVISEEPATTQIPIDMIRRSPKRSTMIPDGAALSRRMRANPEMTVEAMNAETPNVRAYTGRAGAAMPYPRATAKATNDRTATSRGRSARYGVRRAHANTR